MEIAHQLGLRPSGRMMYGLGETLGDRMEHLFRVREVQRKTRGFTAFICWPLQPENSELAHLPKTDAITYLKTQAIARIVLEDDAGDRLRLEIRDRIRLWQVRELGVFRLQRPANERRKAARLSLHLAHAEEMLHAVAEGFAEAIHH